MDIKRLIKGCKKQDRLAQKALLQEFAPTLMSVARRYTPQKMDAEDVLQEAFIKIFTHFKQFDPKKGNLIAWMRKITVNVALKYLQKSKVNRTDEIDEERTVAISAFALEKLKEEDLMKIIDRLPDGYKQVFNMYAIEGYSHKEIATMLEIKEASSRSNFARARQHLQKFLEEENYERPWKKIN